MMIERLVSWVMGIVFTTLFAGFLELLLPASSMQKFVRVIMGLFIMLSILNPVIAFLERTTMEDNVTALAPRLPETVAVEKAAQAASGRRDQLIKAVYRQDLAKQMQALVMGVEGVAQADVIVEFSDEQSGLPRIGEITVNIRPGNKGQKAVQPVVIGPEAPPSPPPQTEALIRKRLSELYQLQTRQIIVNAM